MLRPAHLVLALCACGVVTACSGGQRGDGAAFCAELAAQRDELLRPELRSLADVDAHLDAYRDLAGTAPLAIDEHWDALVVAYETVSTVVAGDAESEQRALARMYATQQSALTVRDWVERNCEIDIPVATVGPAAPPPSGPQATTPPTGG